MSWVQAYARTLAAIRDRQNNAPVAELSPLQKARLVAQAKDPDLIKQNYMNFEPVSNNTSMLSKFVGAMALHPNNPKNLLNTLSTGSYISGNIAEEIAAGGGLGDIIKGAGQGLRAGLVNSPEYEDDRRLVSEVIRDGRDERMSKPAEFLGGLVTDIATDPLSYVGPGLIGAVGKAVKGAKGATTSKVTVDKIANDAEKAFGKELELAKQTGQAVVPTGRVDDFMRSFSRKVNEDTTGINPYLGFQAGDAALSRRNALKPESNIDLPFTVRGEISAGPGATRGFASDASGITTPTVIRGGDVANLAAQRARVDSIMQTMGNITGKMYPQVADIDNVYTNKPKIQAKLGPVTEKVVGLEEVADDLRTLTPGKAHHMAVAHALYSQPKYRWKVTDQRSGQTLEVRMGDLQAKLSKAKEAGDATRAKFYADIIRKEVDRVAQLPKDKLPKTVTRNKLTDELEEVPMGLSQYIWPKGRPETYIRKTGEQSIEAFENFLMRGEVPGNKFPSITDVDKFNAAAEARAQNFLHDIGDLDEFLIPNIEGQFETVRSFLERLKINNGIIPSTPRLQEVKKQIREVMKTEVDNWQRFSDAEKLAWRLKYKDLIKPEDLTYILQGSTPASVKTRIDKVLNKPRTMGFARVSHLEQAYNAGSVTADDLVPLMQLVGAKKPEQLFGDKGKLSKAFADAKKAEDKLRPKPPKAAPKARRTSTKKSAPPAAAPVASKLTATEEAAQEAARQTDELLNPVDRSSGMDSTIWDSVPDRPVSAETIPADYWQTKPKVEVTPEQARIMGVAGNLSVFKNLVDPKKWKFKTAKGTLRTQKIIHQGKGRNLRGWNKFSQSDLFRVLVSESSALPMFSDKAFKGFARNQAMYDHVMPMLQGLEDTLKQLGVSPILGQGSRGLPLGLHDMLSSLPKSMVTKYVIDYGRGMYTTRLSDAVEVALEHGLQRGPYAGLNEAKAAIADILRSKIKTHSGYLEDNWYKHLAKISPEESGRLVEDVTDAILKATPNFIQKVELNSKLAQVKFGEQVKRMTDEVMGAVIKAYQDPNATPGDRLEIIANLKSTANEAAKKLGISDEAAEAAQVQLDARAAETLDRSQFMEARNARAQSKAKNGAESAAVATKYSESIADEVAEEFPELGISEHLDLNMWAKIRRAFDPHYRMGMLRNDYNAKHNSNQAIAREFAQMGAAVAARHSSDNIRAAFIALQRGVDEGLTPEISAAYDELKPMMESVFDPNKNFNIWTRLGVDGGMINKWMKHFGIDEKYMFDPKIRGGDFVDAWKQWENIDDPLDFMSRMHAAIRQAATLRAVGSEFSRLGSATPGKDLFKISPTAYRTEIGPYIDFNRYYSREQVEYLTYFNKFLGETQQTVNNQALQWYDSFLHMYKSGLTIYRPGHHIRNMVGDASLSFLAGVTNPKYAKIAAQTMWRRHQNMAQLEDGAKWDALQALGTQEGIIKSGNLSDKAVTVSLKGGKTKDLTFDELYNYAHSQGLTPSYTVLEDISFDTSKLDALPKRIRKPLGGRVQRLAAGVSTKRDHFVRLTDFAHHLENTVKSYSNIDDAVREAARLTRKWHPDGSDLTHFEKTKLRRIMTFYSWIRKAIPLTLEAMITRPGRFMAYPKAYYNFAEANGIDLQSMTNPFPQDQLFPSWLTEDTTGPIMQNEKGQYYGINPGVTQVDVMNDYFNKPETAARSVLGATVPFIKIPFELASGTDMRSGAKINDWSEYFDRQIPLVTVANSTSNVSPTGTIASVLPGGESPGLDRHRSVERGYENPGPDAAALLNSLLGAGLVNMSKPNYIISAQRELGDRLRNG